jgi:Gp157 protein
LITRSTLLLEQIEDEIEESGEASKEAMDRFELFCQAMNVKADRIGSYLSVMEVRAEHCRKEDAALRSPHEKSSEQIDRTKAMVLYYLGSHDLRQLETQDNTLRRQKISQHRSLSPIPMRIHRI